MKRKLLFSSIFLLVSINAMSQSLFLGDSLKESFYNQDYDNFLRILVSSNNQINSPVFFNQIYSIYEKNGIIRPFLDSIRNYQGKIEALRSTYQKIINENGLVINKENEQIKVLKHESDSLQTLKENIKQDTSELGLYNRYSSRTLKKQDSLSVEKLQLSIKKGNQIGEFEARINMLQSSILSKQSVNNKLVQEIKTNKFELEKLVKDNPILVKGYKCISLENIKNYIQEGLITFGKSYPDNKTDLNIEVSLNGNSSGLSESSIIDATASFIADRMKEELNVAFFEKLKRDLNDSELVVLKTIFPNTFLLLKEDFNYTNYLVLLRTAFVEDLNSIYFNIPKLKITSNNSDLERLKEFYIFPFLKSMKRINTNEHFIGIVADLKNKADKNVKKYLQSAYEVAISLRDTGKSGFLIEENNFEKLWSDTTIRNFYYGILYQQLIINQKLGDIEGIKEFKSRIHSFTNSLYRVGKNFETEIRKISSNKYLPLENEVLSSLDIFSEVYSTVLAYNPQLNSISSFSEVKHDLANLYRATIKHDYYAVITYTYKVYGKFDNDNIHLQKILKYGTFLASVANSKNSNDIKNALNAATLPPGSYSIKRKSEFDFSLQAYPGLTTGWEVTYKHKLGQENLGQINYGFSAPIGFAISWGIGSKLDDDNKDNKKNLNYYKIRTKKGVTTKTYYALTGYSSTVFLSVFDLGPLVLFRLNNNSDLSQKVQLKNVFAPGVFYFLGLKNIPLSLFAGIQYSPELKQVTVSNNIYDLNTLRFNVGVSVDIPLFDLYNKIEN